MFTVAQTFNLPNRRFVIGSAPLSPKTLNSAGVPQVRNIRYEPGFSLIELMVVIVLIGIMAAMIVPEMKGTYEDALLRATSRRLVDVFHLAYSRAVSLNQVHRVRFDRMNSRYFIERVSPNGGGFVPARDALDGDGGLDPRISIEIRRKDDALPLATDQEMSASSEDDRRVQERTDHFAFYSDGTADSGEIVLKDREGFRLSLRINPVTARVQIVELQRQ